MGIYIYPKLRRTHRQRQTQIFQCFQRSRGVVGGSRRGLSMWKKDRQIKFLSKEYKNLEKKGGGEPSL
jgi:hypothetical protein